MHPIQNSANNQKYHYFRCEFLFLPILHIIYFRFRDPRSYREKKRISLFLSTFEKVKNIHARAVFF